MRDNREAGVIGEALDRSYLSVGKSLWRAFGKPPWLRDFVGTLVEASFDDDARDDDHQMLFMHDDVSSDLDLAMLSRREGINAKDTPDGILNRLAETTLGRFINEIEKRPDAGTIELGFLLLTLSEDAVIDQQRDR